MMDVGDMYTDGNIMCILNTPLIIAEYVMKFIDRTSQRFGKLVVKEFAGRNNLKKVLWKCLCDCGKESIVVAGSLVTGNTTSCGCDAGGYKHGGTGKGSYNSWRAMVRRCTNPKDKDYKRYGSKGVSVCERWMDYTNFVADMGEPSGDETLDRINPAGNYEPENTRWASPTVQARNIKVPKSSKTGLTGVLFHNNKYYACITVKRKKYYSKMCNTIEEAAAARKELEQLYWNR
jgi:hypothetical protein